MAPISHVAQILTRRVNKGERWQRPGPHWRGGLRDLAPTLSIPGAGWHRFLNRWGGSRAAVPRTVAVPTQPTSLTHDPPNSLIHMLLRVSAPRVGLPRAHPNPIRWTTLSLHSIGLTHARPAQRSTYLPLPTEPRAHPAQIENPESRIENPSTRSPTVQLRANFSPTCPNFA